MGRFDKVPATVWVLGFCSLLTDVSTEMIHAVLPNYMSVVLKTTFTQIGLIEGVAEALASCLKIFSGSFSDYIGKRKVLLVAGYDISAFLKPLYLIANSTGMVLAARQYGGWLNPGQTRQGTFANSSPDPESAIEVS